MKMRLVWIICLLAALICSVSIFCKMDAMKFNGLRVLTTDRLVQITDGLAEMSTPEIVTKLITLDGEAIPYDIKSNTFYVSQSAEKDNYAGTFASVGKDCSIYLQSDIALKDKQAAIAKGYPFHLWFITQETYSVSDLVFTGLPMISITSNQGEMSACYEQGNVIVQNPNDHDVITMSIKASNIIVKTNYNSDTISFKLYKKGYQEERNLQLLGLGKHSSWKLYPVSNEDGSLVREMLASYIWNCVCKNETMQRNMEYAEVIVNGSYQGLYYLAPKIGKGFLNLTESDRAYKLEGQKDNESTVCEIIGDQDTDQTKIAYRLYERLWEDNNQNFSSVDIDNYINYHIWMQTVCGVRNGTEDYYLIAYQNNDTYEYHRMPDRSKYVFGIYPAEIGWQSLQAAEALMEDDAYFKIVKIPGNTLSQTITDRWTELRDGGLDTEMILQYAYQCKKELSESGYIIRQDCQEDYETAYLTLQHFIRQRMTCLDSYFNIKMK